jgi:hypothetical protein
MTTTTTNTPDTASLLTPFDVLDIAEAIRNAASPHCTSLNPRDRQALAHLTYTPGLRGITRMLLAKLATDTATLPLPDALAMHLMDMNGDNDLLPAIDNDVQEAWLAAHRATALRRVADARPYPEDAWIVNSYASAWSCDLTDIERAAMQDVAWDGTLGRCQMAVLRQVADRLVAPTPQTSILDTVAAYAEIHCMDTAGPALRTAVLAGLLTRDHQLPARDAVELARRSAFDYRVRAAGRDADQLIEQAEKRRLAEQDEPAAVAL